MPTTDRDTTRSGLTCCYKSGREVAPASASAKLFSVKFEWNPVKAEGNLEKHGVSFQEATTVFGDPLSYTFDDPDHSDDEERFLTVGMTLTARLLIVSHTDRGATIRIISARELTRKERSFYEGG